ncbi:MAG: addiction module protein [Bacteroidales bacterium]|nr:addiction module protein [Bacteroidales bacterium]
MELTISIKEQGKLDFVLRLLQEFDYVEILNIKDDEASISIEHKELLQKRLERINKGETTFKSWDLIKKKYEKKTL